MYAYTWSKLAYCESNNASHGNDKRGYREATETPREATEAPRRPPPSTDSSTMAWRSTQQRRIAAESTEEREARLHQLSVTQRQRIAAESTEEREARLQQLRILPNRNNHQDLLINCHSKYIPILLVLIDVFHYAIIEAFVMLFH